MGTCSNTKALCISLKDTIDQYRKSLSAAFSKISKLTSDDIPKLLNLLESDPNLDFNDIFSLAKLKTSEKNIEDFQNRLDNMEKFKEDEGEENWQEWFQDKKWILGSDIARIIDERQTDHTCKYDFLTESHEGFVDLVEIKNPTIKIWKKEKDHNNYVPAGDLTKATMQCAKYIHELELKSNDKKVADNLNILPRCTLVMGRSNSWNEEHWESFRILNSLHHNINIVTYDMLTEPLVYNPEQEQPRR